jgi:hypothetical protein
MLFVLSLDDAYLDVRLVYLLDAHLVYLLDVLLVYLLLDAHLVYLLDVLLVHLLDVQLCRDLFRLCHEYLEQYAHRFL